jgi:hypothetical protein
MLRKTGEILRDSKGAKVGEKVVTRFADGEMGSVVEDSRQMGLFE